MPVVVAVLGALLVTALTPLGDRLRELVFPTRATVTGVVMLGEAPLEGATVTLDGGTTVTTRSNGAFTLDDVRAGDHQVLLEARAVEPREADFVVARGDEERALETITVEPTYRLAVNAVIVPRSRTVSYDVSVWVDAAAPDLDRVDTVTYSLPSHLSPVPVTGGTRAQSFCYRLLTTLPVDELVVFGTPSTITAQLAVADGPPIGLSSLDSVEAPRPPDCLTVQAADSDAGDGDRSSGDQGDDGTGGGGGGGAGEGGSSGEGGDGSTGGGSGDGDGDGTTEETTVVPSVVGLDLAPARSALEAAGLAVDVADVAVDDLAAGTALGTDPPAGAVVPAGSTVTLKVVA